MSLLEKVLRKIMPRRACHVMGCGSVLYLTAQIINPRGERQLIRLGQNCHIKGELLLFGHGGKIELGDYCYVGPNSYIWSAASIRIGNRVLISHNCNIFDSDTHPLDAEARHRQFKEIITAGQPKNIDLGEAAVVIEDDVLIGANAIILKGVTIGAAAIVGAGSVVTRDVPARSIVAGNPARVVRRLDRGGADVR